MAWRMPRQPGSQGGITICLHCHLHFILDPQIRIITGTQKLIQDINHHGRQSLRLRLVERYGKGHVETIPRDSD